MAAVVGWTRLPSRPTAIHHVPTADVPTVFVLGALAITGDITGATECAMRGAIVADRAVGAPSAPLANVPAHDDRKTSTMRMSDA